MFKKLFISFAFLMAIFSANFVFAAPNLDDLSGIGGGFKEKCNVENIAAAANIKTNKTAIELVNNGISIILGVFATIILVVIIYAGVQMISSKGKIDTYQGGLKLLRTAVVAMLIILLAYVIATFVLKTIQLLGKS